MNQIIVPLGVETQGFEGAPRSFILEDQDVALDSRGGLHSFGLVIDRKGRAVREEADEMGDPSCLSCYLGDLY